MIGEVTVGRDTCRHTHAEEKKYCSDFHIHSVHSEIIDTILWLGGKKHLVLRRAV